jgi:hypothetical protein
MFNGERSLKENIHAELSKHPRSGFKLPAQQHVLLQTVHALGTCFGLSLMSAEVGHAYRTSEDSKESDTRAAWWWCLNVGESCSVLLVGIAND